MIDTFAGVLGGAGKSKNGGKTPMKAGLFNK
jgi:hypothetical protein